MVPVTSPLTASLCFTRFCLINSSLFLTSLGFKRKAEEQRKRLEEKRLKAEAEAKRIADEKREKEEEDRRIAEKIAQEQARAVEEDKRRRVSRSPCALQLLQHMKAKSREKFSSYFSYSSHRMESCFFVCVVIVG